MNGTSWSVIVGHDKTCWVETFSVMLVMEAVAQRCFVKKVFLEISKKSRENT